MIIASDIEIPDHCPAWCPYAEEMALFSQGGMCMRCPIFNVQNGLMMAEDYRREWAEEWKMFFIERRIPNLEFTIKGEK